MSQEVGGCTAEERFELLLRKGDLERLAQSAPQAKELRRRCWSWQGPSFGGGRLREQWAGRRPRARPRNEGPEHPVSYREPPRLAAPRTTAKFRGVVSRIARSCAPCWRAWDTVGTCAGRFRPWSGPSAEYRGARMVSSGDNVSPRTVQVLGEQRAHTVRRCSKATPRREAPPPRCCSSPKRRPRVRESSSYKYGRQG